MVVLMVEFMKLLEEAWYRKSDFIPLMLIPMITSLFSLNNIKRVLDFHGFHIGVKFLFPEDIPNLWSFVSLPNPKPGINITLAGVISLIAFTIIGAYLAAGYLGSIKQGLESRTYEFSHNAGKYFIEMLKFRVLILLILFAMMGLALITPLFVLLALPMMIFLTYLIYGTPYLIVSQELTFGEALRKSLDLALNGGKYAEYGIKYLLFAIPISIVMTLLTVNLNIIGIIFGILITAPISLTLTTTTMTFFLEYLKLGHKESPGFITPTESSSD